MTKELCLIKYVKIFKNLLVEDKQRLEKGDDAIIALSN